MYVCTFDLLAGTQGRSCKRRRNAAACAVYDMDNNKNNVSRKTSGNAASVVAIIVVGIFVLCVILLLAKGLFASNSSEVPKGINTATINTDESVPEPAESSAPADTSAVEDDSSAESGVVTDVTDDSSQTDVLEVMYVTEYAYLHVAPDNEAENIVCMSPGVEVNVLEYEDNGYVKITFMNIDGPLTGYIYKDYLTTDSSIAVQW
ncbi:SH3 domain-containing protein [uncultured Ruminococcus sp.]|uniref:SH3 domain-containing protein n=2 Tax=uncultured Ruminococcus sp. TaxID=165186 RepID=UPI0025EC8F58|nr:SH3 domain-containing protein [uncultured Ruminococcus sp.]